MGVVLEKAKINRYIWFSANPSVVWLIVPPLVMLEDIPGWYELIGSNLRIWEGVCAVGQDEFYKLFKIRDDVMFVITVPNNLYEVSSDGYWYCVEITGTIGDFPFYYHCTDPESGVNLLNFVQIEINATLNEMSIRLDDDPLRYENSTDINQRIGQWSNILPMALESNIIIDRNMPL